MANLEKNRSIGICQIFYRKGRCAVAFTLKLYEFVIKYFLVSLPHAQFEMFKKIILKHAGLLM